MTTLLNQLKKSVTRIAIERSNLRSEIYFIQLLSENKIVAAGKLVAK